MDVDKVHLDPNTTEEIQHKIPLGLCKQAVMKMDSAMTDILEIKQDDDLSEEHKYAMEGLAEILGQCIAVVVNMVNEEMEEDEFLREVINMDEIESYPGEETQKENIMDEEI